MDGYERIDNPSFTDWRWAGTAEEGKSYSANFFVTPEGDIFEKVPVYAPAKSAKKLNTIIGRQDVDPSIMKIEAFNALTKRTLLTSSLFHHQAYLRSYMLGGRVPITSFVTEPIRSVAGALKYIFSTPNPVKIVGRALNPFGVMVAGIENMKGYRLGQQAVFNHSPVLKQLVGEGLTLGRVQDWDEAALQRLSTNLRDKLTASRYLGAKLPLQAIDKIIAFQENQTRILFSEIGPFLKAQAAVLEYTHAVRAMKRRLDAGRITETEIARGVAKLINDDFGGLHHKRLGRSQRRTRLLRVLELAEDWTHSNTRTMVKMVVQRNDKTGKVELATGFEGYLYRRFWARVTAKGIALTTVANLAMCLMADSDDDEERSIAQRFAARFKRAWSEGKLRWMDVDMTPIYRRLMTTFGREYNSDVRKYFSFIGHFRDPIKFLSRDLEAFKHKGSIGVRILLDAASGENWAGRRFTTLAELMGFDDKGVYKTTRAGEYEKGDPKGGKLTGQLVTKIPGSGKPVSLSAAKLPTGETQLPSFVIYEAVHTLPIQAQQAIGFAIGEIDAWDAITHGLGIMTSTTYPKKEAESKAAKPKWYEDGTEKKQPSKSTEKKWYE